MNLNRRVDRGAGGRAGRFLRHVGDHKRWQVKVFAGWDGQGKNHYVSEHVYGSKRDAEAVPTEMLQRKNQGRLSTRTTMRLSDLVEEWASQVSRDLSPRTLAGYVGALNAHALPTFCHRECDRVTLRDMNSLCVMMPFSPAAQVTVPTREAREARSDRGRAHHLHNGERVLLHRDLFPVADGHGHAAGRGVCSPADRPLDLLAASASPYDALDPGLTVRQKGKATS